MTIPLIHRAAPAAVAVLDIEVEGPTEQHTIALTVRDRAILTTLGVNADNAHDGTVRAVRAAMARPTMPKPRKVRFHGKTRTVR